MNFVLFVLLISLFLIIIDWLVNVIILFFKIVWLLKCFIDFGFRDFNEVLLYILIGFICYLYFDDFFIK